MAKFFKLALLAATVLAPTSAPSKLLAVSSGAEPKTAMTLKEKLDLVLPETRSSYRSLVDAIVDLAYKYQLPIALEHVTREAVQEPLEIHLHRPTVRNKIAAIVASVPGYKVDFSHGLIDIYSPQSRQDSSNPFNLVIPDFEVREMDTHMADAMLLCELGKQMDMRFAGCGGSVAGDQWGATKVTLHMRNAKVYEVLNAIVAQNGLAIWTPVSLPDLSGLQTRALTNFWYIYPLDPAFERVVVERLRVLFPRAPREEKQ